MYTRDPARPSRHSPSSPSGASPANVSFFRATVAGRVQGVGFRMWTVDVAQSLGVNGWVRNCPGGEVEVEAEGDRKTLEQFARRLQQGPVLAFVRNVDFDWGERTPRFRNFTVGF